MVIKLDKVPLALKQNNYTSKIVNIDIAYNFYAQPRNPTNNLKFKNCLFGETSVIKNSDKEKYVIVSME